MQRVTIRDVAQAAGVSAMTVSNALRDSASVSAPTRRRILRLADKMGYRLDPQMSSVMSRLRKRNQPAYQGHLAMFNGTPEVEWHPGGYLQKILAGAMQQATRKGFETQLVHFNDPKISPGRLAKILKARGITGILLLPLPQGKTSVDFDFSQFSAVSLTRTILRPSLHTVAPHHFQDILRLLGHLHACGYQRFGLITNPDVETRNARAPLAAWYWFHLEYLRKKSLPVLYATREDPRILTWFRQHLPDVVLAPHAVWLPWLEEKLGRKAPDDFGFAAYSDCFGVTAGTATVPMRIGQVGVDTLVAALHRGEIGVPEHPQTTLIGSDLITGKTLRPASVQEIDPALL